MAEVEWPLKYDWQCLLREVGEHSGSMNAASIILALNVVCAVRCVVREVTRRGSAKRDDDVLFTQRMSHG